MSKWLPKYLVLMAVHSKCQPGKPSLQGEGQRMMCCGSAFFQRANPAHFFCLPVRPNLGCWPTYRLCFGRLEFHNYLFGCIWQRQNTWNHWLHKPILCRWFFWRFQFVQWCVPLPLVQCLAAKVEQIQYFVKIDGILLHDFHRFQLFQSCFFGDFVFAIVHVIHDMAYIGNVSNITRFVTQMQKNTGRLRQKT